jgi:hypothetical protein
MMTNDECQTVCYPLTNIYFKINFSLHLFSFNIGIGKLSATFNI